MAAFVRETQQDPDTRMVVLAVLRTHASNGAEVFLGGFALLLFLCSVVFVLTGFSAESTTWVQLLKDAAAVFIFVTVIRVLKAASAAHLRKITCVAWLGAYEDALRANATPPLPPRRHSFFSWAHR